MKFVIVGRTGTGKSELASRLREMGLNVMTSTTTRPPRSRQLFARTSSGNIVRAIPDGSGGYSCPEAKPGETFELQPDLTILEDGCHYFITPEEAKDVPDAEKLLYTTDTGYEYFVTRDEIERADVCVVDPSGLENLSRLLPETSLQLIHAVSVDDAALTRLAIARADDPDVEQVMLAARQQKEDATFRAFEDRIKALSSDPDARTQDADPLYPNCVAIHPFDNDFTDEKMSRMASYVRGYYNLFNNVRTIVEQAVELDIVVSSKPGHVDTVYKSETDDPTSGVQAGQPYVKLLPVEHYVDLLAAHPDMLFTLIKCWLSHDLAIGEPRDVDAANAESTDPDADPALTEGDAAAETVETAVSEK